VILELARARDTANALLGIFVVLKESLTRDTFPKIFVSSGFRAISGSFTHLVPNAKS
jgi:hypothetical protein